MWLLPVANISLTSAGEVTNDDRNPNPKPFRIPKPLQVYTQMPKNNQGPQSTTVSQQWKGELVTERE